MPGNKKVKIQNYYRQWRQLDSEGKGIKKNTETQKAQDTRFEKVIQIWSDQLDKGEVISMSDTNINLELYYNNLNDMEYQDRKLNT